MPSKNPVGWLPYGSDDESILLQHPLTYELVAAAVNCGSITKSGAGSAGTATFDSTLGMRFTNDIGAITYRLLTLTNSALLDNAGQISIEVERDWLCSNESGSTGRDLNAVEECILSGSNGGAQTNLNRTEIYINGMMSNGYCTTNPYLTSLTGKVCRVHSAGKDRFVTLNLGWSGGKAGGDVFLAVDGLIILKTPVRSLAAQSNLFSSLWLGSSNAASYVDGAYWFRNLQISSRAPMFAVNPMLNKIAYWGDSMTVGWDMGTAPNMDCVGAGSFYRELQQRGLYAGEFMVYTHGGHTIANSGGSQLNSWLTELTANNVTVAAIRAGTNDTASDVFMALFEADYKNKIEKILGLNGNPATSVKKLIVATVPTRRYGQVSYPAADQARVAQANTIMAGFEAWFNAAYPSRAGDFAVIDSYAYLGGESPEPVTYLGQLNGAYDDVHFAANGHRLQGEQFGRKLLTMLG